MTETTGDSSKSIMKDPEHESGYFEDGSDIEMCAEETVVTEEWDCHASNCRAFAKAVYELDVRDPSEPVPDHYEDRLTENRGTIFSKKKQKKQTNKQKKKQNSLHSVYRE